MDCFCVLAVLLHTLLFCLIFFSNANYVAQSQIRYNWRFSSIIRKKSTSLIFVFWLFRVYLSLNAVWNPLCTDYLWWISLQVIYTGSDRPVPALQNNQRQVHQWHHQITGSCLATQPQVHKFICTEGLKILTFAWQSWLGLSLLGFEHPPSPCEANALTHCATAAVSHIIGA